MDHPPTNDYFVEVLSEKLSNTDVQQLFTLHGEAEFPNSLNNIEPEGKLVIKFNSKSELIRTMVLIHTKLDEMKKDIALINDLNDDCLAHIFSFLPISDKLNIERVCKRWRELSEKGWNYTTEMSLPDQFSKNQLYVIIQRCGRFLRKLDIKIGPNCIDCLPLIMNFCQLDCLEDIHVTLRRISDIESKQHSENLVELFKKSSELKSGKIEGRVDCYDIDYSNMLASQNLKKLAISYTGNESFNFRINPEDFPNLNELFLDDVVINVADGKTFESLKGLETLTIKKCTIPVEFSMNLKLFTNLKKLALHHNSGISEEDILGIAKNCQKIEILYLHDGEWIDSCFKDLVKMPSLKTLGFSRFDLTFDAINIEHLINVENLSIYAFFEAAESYDGLLHLITHSVKLKNLILHVHTIDQSLRARITNIFEHGLRTIPLQLTFTMDLRGPYPVPTYDGPEHPLLEVTVICWTFCTLKDGCTVHVVYSEELDQMLFLPR